MRRSSLSLGINSAASAGDGVELARLLAMPGAIPLGCAESGCPSICVAAKAGSLECVKILAQASNPESTDHDDNSALMWAAHFGHVDCVEFLLGVCNPEQRNEDGASAAAIAAGSNRGQASSCLALLLKKAKRSLDADHFEMNLFDLAVCHAVSMANVEALCEHFIGRLPFNVFERHMLVAIGKGASGQGRATPEFLTFCRARLAAVAERLAIDGALGSAEALGHFAKPLRI